MSESTNIKQQEFRKLGEHITEKTRSGEIKAKGFIESVEDKVKKIADIGSCEDYGIDLVEDIDRALRKEFRDTIPTGIDFIDGITKGGLGKGEAGIILSPSGFGKSSMLTKIANTAYVEGKNVLQIIFEDTEDQIRRKHYAILSKIPLSEFENNEDLVKHKVIDTVTNNKNLGNLIIKRFVEDETTIPEIKKWIDRYQKKFNIKFDILILDYLDCLDSHKKTSDPNEAEKIIIKAFMDMAAEYEIPGWSAVQASRNAFSSEWVDATQTGGSIKRIQKSHLFISIAKTVEQKENNLANVQILKFRSGADGQRIGDCIFNNDTMEIRSTDNKWQNSLKKYSERDLEALEEKANRLHIEVSKYDNKSIITDVDIIPNTDFSDESDFDKMLLNSLNEHNKNPISDIIPKIENHQDHPKKNLV